MLNQCLREFLMCEKQVFIERMRIVSRPEAPKKVREVGTCSLGRVWGHVCYRFLRDGDHGRPVWVRHGDGIGYASLGLVALSTVR